MSQYSLYSNPNPSTKKLYPYLLDVQSPLLDSLETRLVIPLCLKVQFPTSGIKNLTPTISINSEDYLILTPQMAAIKKKYLGDLIQDCSSSRNEVLASIDFLITGF